MNNKRWISARAMSGLLASVFAMTAFACMIASPAKAEMDVDLRGGYYFDMSAPSLGGGLLTTLGHGSRWDFNPNLEIAFGSGFTESTLNADFHYDLPVSGGLAYWLGAGPAILMSHAKGGGSSTDLGLNLFGGLGGARGEVRPFVQLKGIISSGSELALMGGVRF